MAVGVYVRVSTEEQKERQSILTQRDFAQDYCRLWNLSIYEIYSDDGVSGTVPVEKRPGGRRLLADARLGRFDQILVFKLDRLGRHTNLILDVVDEMKERNIRVRSMSEEFDSASPSGYMVLTILSSFATHERQVIRERSVLGAEESRRMKHEGRVPVLKKSRWLLLRGEQNLKDEQRFRLRDLLRYNLKTVRAYLLKEAFQQLWDHNSPAWAGKFLDEWCRQTMRSRIEPTKKIARSLRQHRELILNYFRAQKLLSSGVVEGLNNKAKVTMRKAYGFRTFRVLELALYHSPAKLPEPDTTHEFF